MQQSQFHSPEELESDRMTDAEAAQVVRLWAENQRAAPPVLRSTSIQDVAEGLDIAPERARAMLQKVRQGPKTLQEISVPVRAQPHPAFFTALSLLAAGLLVFSMAMGSWSMSVMAIIALLSALIMSRRLGLAALALLSLVLLYGLFARSSVRPPAAEMAAPPVFTVPAQAPVLEPGPPQPPPPVEAPLPR